MEAEDEITAALVDNVAFVEAVEREMETRAIGQSRQDGDSKSPRPEIGEQLSSRLSSLTVRKRSGK